MVVVVVMTVVGYCGVVVVVVAVTTVIRVIESDVFFRISIPKCIPWSLVVFGLYWL